MVPPTTRRIHTGSVKAIVGCSSAKVLTKSSVLMVSGSELAPLRPSKSGLIHPRKLWVLGSNVSGGSQPAKLPWFGGCSLENLM